MDVIARVPVPYSGMEPPRSPTTTRAAQPRVELTRKRLWVLYQVAGLIKAQIEDVTGWTRGEIDGGLDKWRMRAGSSDSYWATNRALENAVLRMLDGDRAAVTTYEQLRELRYGLQAKLGEALVRGPIDWDAVDALPWPEESPVDRV